MPEASDVPEAPESSNPAAENQSVLIFYGGIFYFPDPGVNLVFIIFIDQL